MRMFKWNVEFSVSENWVADGFDLDDIQVLEMLAKRLGFAIEGTEIKARVTKRPSAFSIRHAQGWEEPKKRTA